MFLCSVLQNSLACIYCNTVQYYIWLCNCAIEQTVFTSLLYNADLFVSNWNVFLWTFGKFCDIFWSLFQNLKMADIFTVLRIVLDTKIFSRWWKMILSGMDTCSIDLAEVSWDEDFIFCYMKMMGEGDRVVEKVFVSCLFYAHYLITRRNRSNKWSRWKENLFL